MYLIILKGSYDVAKKNIILCILFYAMCLCGLRFKKTFSSYCNCTLLLLLYAPSFWNALIFTKLIVLRSEACSDWPAIQCVVIGRIPQEWDGNVTPLTVLWCRVKFFKYENILTGCESEAPDCPCKVGIVQILRYKVQIREWMFRSEVNFNRFPLLRE